MSRARDTAEVAEEIDLKVDYSTPVNEQTGTSYTFQLADARKLTTASSASAVTLTIPPQSEVTWENDTILRVVNYGAGALTVAGGSGVTVTNTATTLAQYESAAAIRTGSDAWTLVPFSGGVGDADFSNTATGTYTSGGNSYKFVTFNASGTLTVTKSGFVDFLMIAGGGGGTGNRGGGGGAGGYLVGTSMYLPSGSLTVTVGAGGVSGGNGNASRLDLFYSIAGGTGGIPGGSGGGGNFNGGGASGTAGLGNNGGSGNAAAGGGGGGASANGSNAGGGDPNWIGGNGGAGSSNSITGSSVTRAGGGGGGAAYFVGGTGGSGGGGNGSGGSGSGGSGTANTGSGGGGGGFTASNTPLAGGPGGSGVVIIRVKV